GRQDAWPKAADGCRRQDRRYEQQIGHLVDEDRRQQRPHREGEGDGGDRRPVARKKVVLARYRRPSQGRFRRFRRRFEHLIILRHKSLIGDNETRSLAPVSTPGHRLGRLSEFSVPRWPGTTRASDRWRLDHVDADHSPKSLLPSRESTQHLLEPASNSGRPD